MSISLFSTSGQGAVVFQFTFSDKKVLMSNFQLLWSVANFVPTQYKNGQTSTTFKILQSDLIQTTTQISLQITDGRTNLVSSLNYNYTKQSPPSRCSCLVTPFTGTFLVDPFTFYIKGCDSNSRSLSYKYFHINKESTKISFSGASVFTSTFTSKMVPLSLNNVYTVEITDTNGLSSSVVCPLIVNKQANDTGLTGLRIANLVSNTTDKVEKLNVILDLIF